MWTPDIRTLFLILFLVNIFLTLLLFTFWKTQKTYDGFRTWMLSLLVTSCGFLLLVFRGSLPDLLTFLLADLLIVLSILMRLDSTRKYFLSRALPLTFYSILIPYVLLFLFFTYGVDSVVIRGVIIGIIVAPCLLMISCIAIRFREPETRLLRYGFAASFLIPAILGIAILVFALIIPGDHTLFGPDPQNSTFFFVALVIDIFSTGSFLMLNMARSQAGIRESKERYRNLADNLPDYIIIHDGEVIRYANPAATRLLGPVSGTLAGQSICSLQTPAGAGVSWVHINATRNGGSPDLSDEIDIRLRDSTVRHCMIQTVRINDKGTAAFLSVITDITERKVTEDALSRANKKLTILSSITRHDIKNQLMALNGYILLCEDAVENPVELREYIAQEQAIANTIAIQIDFTKVYEDMGTTTPVWQNIRASVRRAVAALPMRDVKVEVDRSDLEIYADSLFEKVFYNLIGNALNHGGGALTTIRITSRETDTGLIIACEDDGAGISAEDKAHLFVQGFGKHTGLGLFLSREILSITGITITETSEPGKGARFEMAVPKRAYRLADEAVMERQT